MLYGYKDEAICDFLEFGFPLGYVDKIQHQNPKSYTFVRNHSGAKHFSTAVQKCLSKEKSSAVKYMCQISHVSIENYLDDLAGADTPDKALKSFYELGKILEFCELEEALEKSCPASTQWYLYVYFLTQKA